MKCNQICKWNSNVGCVKPYGVPCILENVSPTGKKATNADRIRSMNDGELAKLLLDGRRGSKCDDQPQNEWGSMNCFQCMMNWLQQPAEDGDHD